jgi:hypothetical protein
MKLNEIKNIIKSYILEVMMSPDMMKKIKGRRFIPKEFTVTNDLLNLIKAKTVANGKYIFIDNVVATKLNDKTSELRKYAIQSKGEANKNRMIILALVKYLTKDNVQPKLGGFLIPTLRVDNSGQPVIKNPYKQEEEV